MKKGLLSKALIIALSAAMISSTFAGCGKSTTADASAGGDYSNMDISKLKGTLTFWHFNKDEGPRLGQAFMDKFPNIKVDTQITADTDMAFQNKISAAVRAGSGLPDVFAAESAYVKRFVSTKGIFADLSKAPYNASSITKKMVPYTVGIGKDNNGDIRALSWQATPAGIGYKRSIAKQYLGTDDPDQISAMLATPDKMIETGNKLKTASNGKVRLFAGVEELKKVYLGGRKTGWEKGGKLVIDPKLDEFIDVAKKLRDQGLDSAYGQWTPAWSASIGGADSLCYAMPTWGVANIIGANDKKAKGNWAIAKSPFPYFWGGTWLGISAQTKNTKLAWAFVKYIATDEEHLSSWSDQTGDFVNNTDVIKKKIQENKLDPTTNQNIYNTFNSQLSSINGNIFTPNDDKIENDFTDALKTYLSGGYKTKDDFIKAFKDKVKSDFPDLKVD